MVEIFVNIRPICVIFMKFSEFLPKISSILVKYVKIVNKNLVDFIFKDQRILLIILI